MFNLESDKNPLRIIAVLSFFIPFLIILYCHLYQRLSLDLAFNIMGIVCNFVGALWIASGVYLLSEDFKHLDKGKKTRSKYVSKLSGLLISASRTIPLGIFYIFIGSLAQITSAI